MHVDCACVPLERQRAVFAATQGIINSQYQPSLDSGSKRQFAIFPSRRANTYPSFISDTRLVTRQRLYNSFESELN